jgi:orotate phosphoribosyltransferase
MNLKEYIKNYYLHKSEESYTLASGTKSNIYFDIKGLMLNPKSAMMVYHGLIDLIIKKVEGEYFTVVGMELGGAQIVQLLVSRGFNGMIVRKNKKKYGLEKRMEGTLIGENIVIVDDVITSGNTVKEVEQIISAPNRQILGTFCVVDRTEKQEYNSLFKESDFI